MTSITLYVIDVINGRSNSLLGADGVGAESQGATAATGTGRVATADRPAIRADRKRVVNLQVGCCGIATIGNRGGISTGDNLQVAWTRHTGITA